MYFVFQQRQGRPARATAELQTQTRGATIVQNPFTAAIVVAAVALAPPVTAIPAVAPAHATAADDVAGVAFAADLLPLSSLLLLLLLLLLFLLFLLLSLLVLPLLLMLLLLLLLLCCCPG